MVSEQPGWPAVGRSHGMSWETCLSKTLAMKCLDIELLLLLPQQTPTKDAIGLETHSFLVGVTLPCLLPAFSWCCRGSDPAGRAGRHRHSQVPTMLHRHQNTDQGAAKIQILLLRTPTTCSKSAFICRPPGRPAFHLAEHLGASRDPALPVPKDGAAHPCPG